MNFSRLNVYIFSPDVSQCFAPNERGQSFFETASAKYTQMISFINKETSSLPNQNLTRISVRKKSRIKFLLSNQNGDGKKEASLQIFIAIFLESTFHIYKMIDDNLLRGNLFCLANVDAKKVLESLDDDDYNVTQENSRKRKRLDDFTPQEKMIRRYEMSAYTLMLRICIIETYQNSIKSFQNFYLVELRSCRTKML